MIVPALFTLLNTLLLTALIWRLRTHYFDVLDVLYGMVVMLMPILGLVVLIFILGFAGFTIAVYFSVLLMAVGIVMFQRFKRKHLARVLGGAMTLWVANFLHGYALINFWLLLQQYA